MNSAIREYLVVFVALAGDYDNIALLGAHNRFADTLPTVGANYGAAAVLFVDSSHNICDDQLGVLRAGIVGCYHQHIGEIGGYFAHNRAFSCVPIATTTERHDQSF
jgi:hypothetical protein